MRKWILPWLMAGGLSWVPLVSGQTDTPEQKAAALVKRMTLDEKVSQMMDQAAAIPRLNIPAYGWWNEALHGVARNGLATVFPQAIGLAATWDTGLQFRIGDTISTEARAKYNLAIARGQHGRYQGLTFWSPNINIFRDPRWGRGQETYGEDPYLTGEMGKAFIHGMQGSDPKYLKTIATSKHFAVHSGPETGRHSFDAIVTEQDLKDTYLRAFRATLEGNGAQSAMCSYNRINGVPACANVDLLQTRLHQQWGFRGYVVSDCGAVDDIASGHHWTANVTEASAKAVKAGVDLDCGTEYKTLSAAVNQGLLTEDAIDAAVTRLLAARIRLGILKTSERDPVDPTPFSKIGPAEIASPSHAALALEAAEKSMVLLKNNGVLPWTTAPKNVAVIGPAADDPDTLLGNYYGTPPHLLTPLAGIRQLFGNSSTITSAQGSLFAEGMPALVSAQNLTGLKAEYSTENKVVTSRTEDRIYFRWAMRDQTLQQSLPQPAFVVKWTAQLHASHTGDYQLGLAWQECDSCSGSLSRRITLEGKALFDETAKSASGAGSRVAPVHLDAGKLYDLRVEYSQTDNGPGVELVWIPPAAAMLNEATEAARKADAVVLCLGLNSRLEGEELRVKVPGFAGGDRTDLSLPGGQEKLLNAVLATGKPVVVVLLNGSALAVNTAAEQAAAILEAWYPGQEGGLAIARTLAGDNNPAGRLPVTFYRSVDQLPPFADYKMASRTYRYLTSKPLFPFGFGLSYSRFSYEQIPSDGNTCRAKVTNMSSRDGDEVTQLYRFVDGGHWELAGFRRIHLAAGESQTVAFPASADIVAGRWEISGSQPGNAPRNLKHTNAARP